MARNLRSSLGPQLDRAERLSCDSSGRRIPRLDPHARVVLVRETRGYYDGADAGAEDLEAHADGAMRVKIARLTDDELRCVRLHQARGQELEGLLSREQLDGISGRKWARVREVRVDVPRSEEAAKFDEGWLLEGHTKSGRRSHMVKNFPTCLGYEQIAEVTGLPLGAVRRNCLSAYAKLGGR